MSSPPTCVVYNPAAGRGRAGRLLAEAQKLSAGAELRPTTGPGSAVELARTAAESGFARVVAAGGDGTAHEVANGLLQAGRPDVVFAVWPLGSMNDYAFTLGLDAWWHSTRDPTALRTLAADVGLIESDGRREYFVNGCGAGFTGMVTIESRSIRWLRGLPLYALAVIKAMVNHFAAPPAELTVDGVDVSAPMLTCSLGLGQREGGFPLTPLARLDDGWFDFFRVGEVRRWDLVRYFPGLMTGNLPVDLPKVAVGRCKTVRIRSTVPLCVHADGEFFCTPTDGVRDVTVSLLPNRLRVETYPPALYGGGRFDRLEPRLAPRFAAPSTHRTGAA